MKFSLALAGAALLAGTLTACGGSDGGTGGSSSEYCKDLKSASAGLGSLTNPDLSKLDDAFAQFDKLSAEAPGSIKGDWKTLDSAVEAIQKAFADAGLKFSDLSKLKPGSKLPAGVDASKVAGLVGQIRKLNTPEFTKASDAITAHAKTTCKLTIQ